MFACKKHALTAAIALATAQTVVAGSAPFFTPLTKPEIVEIADSVDERNAPWSVPFGLEFKNLMSMEEVETGVQGSILRVGAGNVSSMFDMLAYDRTGENIFIPHETPFGAGVSRYNVQNDLSEVLFKGDESGADARNSANFLNNTDFGAFDPVRYTPNDTLIAGEEWAGAGRLIEICDPFMAAPADPTAGGSSLTTGNCNTDPSADWRVLDNLPLVAWEGISFSLSQPNDVIYYVDEDRSGSVYKTVFTTPGAYNGGGVTYVLVDDDYIAAGGDPSARWDVSPNTDAGVDRTGSATWVAITDATGAPLPGIQDPREVLLNNDGTIVDQGEAGRIAANQVNGTPYGRPEDTTISTLASGNEVVYWTATSENSVYAVEELAGPTGTTANVTRLAGPDTPINAGFAPTAATLGAPDNLAIDSLGNIYIIEDSPNTSTVGADGGDIWFAEDKDNDGVAESIHHFMSLQVNQSEATGMIFHPTDPTKFVVAVQHPASTALADLDFDGVRDMEDVLDESGNVIGQQPVQVGFGDAIWEFDLTNIQPPECKGPRSAFLTFNAETRRWVRACSTQRDFNAIDQIVASEDPSDFPTP